jgi:hypothetical protein
MAMGCLRASTAADAGPWITESFGLTVMTTSAGVPAVFEEVVPQPARAKTASKVANRLKYEGSMLNCLIFE